MRARRQVPEEVLRLARRQGGTLARFQVLDLGLTPTVVRRLVADGRWSRLEDGIYLLPDVEPSWQARVWAGILLGGPDARAGGRTAAALHTLADEELPVEILVPFGVKINNRHWATFHQERSGARAVSNRAQPPRTRVEDTVLDLCANGSTADRVSWITQAVQRRLTTAQALQTALGRRARISDRKGLTSLIADVASGVHSALEYRYLHEVERGHGLPPGKRQHARPGRNGFVDVAYVECALVVELDGRVGHVGEGRFRDRRRDNSHTRSGLRTLRFGWDEVSNEPCAVALEVAEVLIGLGWSGYPARCPRCR